MRVKKLAFCIAKIKNSFIFVSEYITNLFWEEVVHNRILEFNKITMKKIMLKSVVIALAGTTLFSSCIGSFSLFNKLAKWNVKATDNKFLNAIIGVVISPAYGICMFADWLVLNSVEFWTGEKLMADTGQTQPVIGTNGDFYLITTLVDGYCISNETTKQTSYLKFDKDNSTWSYEVDGNVSKLLRMNADNTLTVFLPTGETMDVTNDAEGLQQVQALINPNVPFMAAK